MVHRYLSGPLCRSLVAAGPPKCGWTMRSPCGPPWAVPLVVATDVGAVVAGR